MSESITEGIRDYTTMDFAKIDQVLAEWETIVGTFEMTATEPTMVTTYKELIDAQLDNKFAEDFDKNIGKLITALRNLKSTLKAEEDNMEFIDTTVRDKIPPAPDDDQELPADDATVEDSTVPTDEQLVDNSKEQLNGYRNMSMNDLSTVAAELNKLAEQEGKTLDNILNNDEYSERVRNTLLMCPNIPDDLKQLITDASSTVSLAVLSSIFNGNNSEIIGLNENTKMTLKTYLGIVANVNNLSVEDLVNNENNSVILKDAMKNFNNVTETLKSLSDDQIGNKVLSIYDGDGIDQMDSSAVMIIRDHADIVAHNQNSDIETVLTSSLGAEEFKNLGKFSVFAGNLNGYDNSSITSILNALIK